MASAVVSTLHHVTDRKLDKLAEQQATFVSRRAQILAVVDKAEKPADRVQALITSFAQFDMPHDSDISTKNIKSFVNQSRHDSTVSATQLKEWEDQLRRELDIGTRMYEHAALFGRLVTEWLQDPDKADATSSRKRKASDADGMDTDSDTFEEVGRAEMHEQRKEWESYAFVEHRRDQKDIAAYLYNLFVPAARSKKLQDSPLQILQQHMNNFAILPNDFSPDKVKICIQGLLKTDIFAGTKRQALMELQSQATVLQEMADVLNMDLASIDTWQWKPIPVKMHQRRQLNGKYRVFMDEEIHQAILLHYIGTRFAIHLKDGFRVFFRSNAWKHRTSPLASQEAVSSHKHHRERRNYFLGSGSLPSASNRHSYDSKFSRAKSVRDVRWTLYEKDFFMTHLPNSFEEGSRPYGDDQTNNRGTYGEEVKDGASPLEIKQLMLRFSAAEMLLNTKLHGEFTIWQSDFKWFGPALSHDTIFAVLEFLHMPKKWQTFFRKFLEAPLAFAQDGPNADGQTRKCGIPMSHALSEAMGESILFCLDFAVNQRTNGSNLYRFHDDLWFWGQEATCVTAWETLTEFSRVMGVKLNEEKTNAALIIAEGRPRRPISPALPAGTIKWGFLNLDDRQGRWIIDDEQVEKHIEELRRQLNACHSIFAWVQAFNTYFGRFMSTNFGQPANCFGKPHIDMLINTFEKLASHFKTSGQPDGFFYFPVILGGLELRNPFINLFALSDVSLDAPMDRFEQALEFEERDYATAKERYEDASETIVRPTSGWRPADPSSEPFFSLAEYSRFCEETSEPLFHAFESMLDIPDEEHPHSTQAMHAALSTVSTRGSAVSKTSGFTADWVVMDPYWKWVIQLCFAEVVKQFRGLQMANKDFLPRDWCCC